MAKVKDRLTECQGMFCGTQALLNGSGIDFDAGRKQRFGQVADLRALTKQGLSAFVRNGNLVFGIDRMPQQLLALQALKNF